MRLKEREIPYFKKRKAPSTASIKSSMPVGKSKAAYLARDALMHEREIREYEDGKFGRTIEELRYFEKRALMTDFARAAKEYASDNPSFAKKLYAVASRYSPTEYNFAREIAEIEESPQRESLKPGKLERGISPGVLAIISFLLALISISSSLTGNAIGNSLKNNSWIGIGLFFLGCLFTLLHFKMKNQEKKPKNKKKRQ